MEALTDDIEKRILAMVQDIESQDTIAALCENGWFSKVFINAMERYSKQVDDGELQKVGVNTHCIPEEEDTLLKDMTETKIEPAWERAEVIAAMRRNRDPERFKATLTALYDAAVDRSANLMYPIVDAMRADATMGEMIGTMRRAYDHPYDPHRQLESPI